MKYGFVTFARPCDAFTAIDDSSKNSAICHYDISFGGRRAFCREKYLDLGKKKSHLFLIEESLIHIYKKRNTNPLDLF